MKETQEILLKMGFENPNFNVWKSDWFGYFILLEDVTPEELAKFIFNRGKIIIKNKTFLFFRYIIICYTMFI